MQAEWFATPPAIFESSSQKGLLRMSLPARIPCHAFIAFSLAFILFVYPCAEAASQTKKPVRSAPPLHSAPTHPTLSSILPAHLQVEFSRDPVGIDLLQPRLSWKLSARTPNARGLTETAWRILVASTPELLASDQGDVWDSQKVTATNSLNAPYQGGALFSAHTYYWKVVIWDQDDHISPWSATAKWTTGLLHPKDWSAKWIAATPDGPPSTQPLENRGKVHGYGPPLPIFRHEFPIDKSVSQATVFVSGMGQYELHLNGQLVTDTLLNPGWTDYRKTILYNSFDVTRILKQGSNAFGVLLGNGMYNVEGTKGRYTKFIGTYGQPKLILQLQIDFTDGTSSTVISDNSWNTAPGPITYSSTYGGEDYDARREQSDWDTPSFDDATWAHALEVAGPGGQLVSQMLPPITVDKAYTARTITEPKPGSIVYDLGQNFSGWPEIRVHGPRGSTVTLTAGELLDKDGLVTQHSANASSENANCFTYTLRGIGTETWHPRFSYWGFRYVQVDGAARETTKDKPTIVFVKGQFLHAAVPVVGRFSTSNELFQRIHTLIDMAILSNMVSVLTDCPHREKLGWLEQTHLAGPSILYNYDAAQFYRKMARDMRDAQLRDGMVPGIAPEYVAFVDDKGNSTAFRDSPEWGSASILSPWTAYSFYGDRTILADNYKTMTAYAKYLRGKLQDGMLTYGLGDWYDIGPGAPGYSQLTSQGMTATATYFEDMTALAQIATILGKDSDASTFRKEATAARNAINAHLLHTQNGFYDRDSQTANAIPLALNLVPEAQQQQVLDHLVADIRKHENHVTAGDIGFHYVVRALTDLGRSDVLNDMMQRTDSPSYGYQLQNGATTLTEAWDTNPDSSQNHFMLGHAEEWFYRGLAGIDFDLSRPAPESITIQPSLVSGTNDASATYDSVLGTISSSWHRVGKKVRMDIAIPPGASATIYIPAGDAKSILESGKPLEQIKEIQLVPSDGATKCIVGSGAYHFAFSQ